MIASVRSTYGSNKAVHVIDVPVRKSIEGYIYHGNRVYKNIIVSNFFKLLLGLLNDINAGGAVATTGSVYVLRTSGDINLYPAKICTGSGTGPETFTDYRIVTVECLATTVTLSGNRISLSGPATKNAAEIGVIQTLYTSGAATVDFLLARRAATILPGYGVVYDFVFGNPFTSNLVSLMYGVLANIDSDMYDADTRSVFTARTTGDFNNGGAYLVVTGDAVAYNFNLITIPNPIYITTDIASMYTSDANYIALAGRHRPTADTVVNTVAIYQNIFDTSGAYHRVLFAVLPLPSPIILRGGVTNMLVTRLVAI